MDKRFEELHSDIDRRLEQVDKLFNQMFVFLITIFTVIGPMVSVFGIIR